MRTADFEELVGKYLFQSIEKEDKELLIRELSRNPDRIRLFREYTRLNRFIESGDET